MKPKLILMSHGRMAEETLASTSNDCRGISRCCDCVNDRRRWLERTRKQNWQQS